MPFAHRFVVAQCLDVHGPEAADLGAQPLNLLVQSLRVYQGAARDRAQPSGAVLLTLRRQPERDGDLHRFRREDLSLGGEGHTVFGHA